MNSLQAEDPSKPHRSQLPKSVAALLAILWIIASIIYTGSDLHPAQPAPEAIPERRTADASMPSLDEIKRLNLFGKRLAEPVIDPANLPATQLNLKLAGIFSSTKTGDSRALISEDGKPAKMYFLGDALSGQAIVHDITQGFVIIQRGEHLEKLQLHNSAVAQISVRRRTAITSFTTDLLAARPPITETSEANATSPGTPVTPQDYFREVDVRIAEIRSAKAAN